MSCARMSHCYKKALMSHAVMSRVHKCRIAPYDTLMSHSIIVVVMSHSYVSTSLCRIIVKNALSHT
jgi:hypothetical protein